jgi:DNA-binding beta-propeller fold protein YncE
MSGSRQRCALTVFLAAAACVAFLAVATAGADLAQEGEIGLPPQYDYEIIYRPLVTGLSGIVASHDGTLYVRHLRSDGGVQVSLLDVDAGSFGFHVVDEPPETSVSTIVGGPDDTVFVWVDGEFRKFSPDGSSTPWGTISPGVFPMYYSEDDHMYGISDGGTSVVELFGDGSYHTLFTELTSGYDLVAADQDTIIVSDIGAGELGHLTYTGTYTVVAQIAPDNTELAFDQAGDLYVNSAEKRFAKFDLATLTFTEIFAPNADCAVIKSPSGVAFDSSNRAVFASWAENMITWADLITGTGGVVIDQPWSNSHSGDIGPDEALYLAVTGCGSDPPSSIERFGADGSQSTYLDGLVGEIHGLAFDSSENLYISLGTETSNGVYVVAPATDTLTLVPDSENEGIHSIAVHPTTGHVFGYAGQDAADELISVVVELSATLGLVGEHHFQMPITPTEVLLDFAPDDTLYAFVTEKERFMTGPEVERWILRLDLETDSTVPVDQINRVGCCPMGSFSIDYQGYIWWLLNPDFLLYRIPPGGTARLFAENLPVDAGYVNRNADRNIFLNSPDGLYLIWPWATHRANLPLALQ